MMELGTHPLPEKLLLQIGRIVAAWSAIEQTLTLNLKDLFDLPHIKKEAVQLSFNALREQWRRVAKRAYEVEFHAELDQMHARLEAAARNRNFALHGVWRVNMSGAWNLHGGKDYQVFWWRQEGDELVRMELPTDFAEVVAVADTLETLRLDLLALLRRTRLRESRNW